MFNTSLTRRSFLRLGASGLAFATLGRLMPRELLAQGGPAGGRRPNIIVFLADDMGYSDIGCYGGEVKTPNIDRLAQDGVRFTQCYNTARCCPTRASLLTGLYAHQAGIGHMSDKTELPAYQGTLNGRCVTIAEVLRSASYRTLMVGKWHLGANKGHWPLDRGFDEFYGLVPGGSNYWKPQEKRLARGNEYVQPEGKDFYTTDAFGAEAARMLDARKGKNDPFFLYLAFNSPHWPLHAWPEDIRKYMDVYKEGWNKLAEARRKRMIEMGLVKDSWRPHHDLEDWDSQADKGDRILRMATYAAQIDRMDQNTGRVLTKLKEIGQEENTLVLFLSDNGGCAEIVEQSKPGAVVGTVDSFCSYGRNWATLSNTPYRLHKHWVHEGGISTPLIARWPARKLKGGTLVTEPTHLIDLMPTCVELAGAQYPAKVKGADIHPMEGRSIVPALEGKPQAERAIFWEHEGNRAIRQGKWKAVLKYPGQWELHDIEADRTEMTNLAAKEPAKLEELKKLYDAWAQRCQVEPWDKVKKAIADARKTAPAPANTPAPAPASQAAPAPAQTSAPMSKQ